MELWRKVWREGFAPQFSREQLAALRAALAGDDERLLQGATVSPPPTRSVMDWPVEAACPVAWCGWQDGAGLNTVEEINVFFGKACAACDEPLLEPAACRHFLGFWDETPRAKAVAALLEEVERELAARVA